MWLKLNEIHGGPLLINMDRVERVTKETGGKAKLWFSADDADTLNVQEYFDEVESKLIESRVKNKENTQKEWDELSKYISDVVGFSRQINSMSESEEGFINGFDDISSKMTSIKLAYKR